MRGEITHIDSSGYWFESWKAASAQQFVECMVGLTDPDILKCETFEQEDSIMKSFDVNDRDDDEKLNYYSIGRDDD